MDRPTSWQKLMSEFFELDSRMVMKTDLGPQQKISKYQQNPGCSIGKLPIGGRRWGRGRPIFWAS